MEHTKFMASVNRNSTLSEIPIEKVKEAIIKKLDEQHPEGYNILRWEEKERDGVIGVKAFIDK